jgi:hypothetical protein
MCVYTFGNKVKGKWQYNIKNSQIKKNKTVANYTNTKTDVKYSCVLIHEVLFIIILLS